MKRILRSLITLSLAFFAAVSLTAIAAPAVVKADHAGDGFRPWVDNIRAVVRSGQYDTRVFDLTVNSLDMGTRARLEEIAYDQAQIWADTILEGDYLAAAEVALDSVEAISRDNQFLGFRIIYSSSAVDISDCDARVSYDDCQKGRIVEATLVSPDMGSWVRDDRSFAEFQPFGL
ncbi:MAG: hypothetical protein RBT63_06025 [Bdellovibrionales bacterium]|jgi:hypothetical protein|nr:hypothetical protein [Bdellovibrionales bacterium]